MAIIVKNKQDSLYAKDRLLFDGEPVSFKTYKHDGEAFTVETVIMQGDSGQAVCKDQLGNERWLPIVNKTDKDNKVSKR